MKQKILTIFFVFLFCFCYSQDIQQTNIIDTILYNYYSFESMQIYYNDSMGIFGKQDGCLNIYITYSDKTKNVSSGWIEFLIDQNNQNRYKYYSSYRYLDFKKAGYSRYPGSMETMYTGWYKIGTNEKLDSLIILIQNQLK